MYIYMYVCISFSLKLSVGQTSYLWTVQRGRYDEGMRGLAGDGLKLKRNRFDRHGRYKSNVRGSSLVWRSS